MNNSVRSRPNHYELLGITPAATDDEIREAFERKMSECRWHPMGPSARLCIAFETLSNRFKRTDYDRSLGLEPGRQPRLSAMTVTQERWAPFIASAPTNALGQAAREAAAEPQVSALPNPHVRARPEPQERRRPPKMLDPQLRQMLAPRLAGGAGSREPEDRLGDWKRPVLAVGGFVLAAGLIGAFAGLSVRDEEGSAQAEPQAAIAVPTTAQYPKAAAAALPFETEADADAAPAVRKPRTAVVSRRHGAAFESGAVAAVATADDEANAEVPSQGSVAQPVSADLPLSDAVIARTIDRIGYSCGQVTSTASTASGGFSVTCSSGQSYNATRVRGRYHFRRSH